MKRPAKIVNEGPHHVSGLVLDACSSATKGPKSFATATLVLDDEVLSSARDRVPRKTIDISPDVKLTT